MVTITDTMCMVIAIAERPVVASRTVVVVMQAAAVAMRAAAAAVMAAVEASIEPHNRFKNQR
jgi:hypothetical protein